MISAPLSVSSKRWKGINLYDRRHPLLGLDNLADVLEEFQADIFTEPREGTTAQANRRGEIGKMIRNFTIHDSPNKQGFDRFTIRTDNGKPYLENDPTITTSDELRLIERLIQWIKAGKV